MSAFSKPVYTRVVAGLAGLILALAFALPARSQDTDSTADEPTTTPSTDDNSSLAPKTSDNADDSGVPDDPADSPSDSYFGGPIGPNYILGPEDVVNLSVFDVQELKNLVVRISNDGSIAVPLLGRVKAAGLTSDQLRHELEEKWGESYLQNPQVTIFVKQFRAKPVSIIGAVEKPGLYPLTAPRTLVEVLSMAGGLGKKASGAAGRTAYITRAAGFGDLKLVPGMRLVSPSKLEIDLHDLLYSKDNTLNIAIKPLDEIAVTKAPVIYVVGEVKKAGGFVIDDRDKVTVLQALALAEGLYGSPSKKHVQLIRNDSEGSRKQIPLDLGKILNGKAPDVEMAANDILFVPSSAGKAVLKQATTAAVATVSGLIIWHY